MKDTWDERLRMRALVDPSYSLATFYFEISMNNGVKKLLLKTEKSRLWIIEGFSENYFDELTAVEQYFEKVIIKPFMHSATRTW